MNRSGAIPILWLLLAAATPVAAAVEEAPVTQLYEVRHLNVEEGALLARQRCLELGAPRCDYNIRGRNFFEFIAAPQAQESVRAVLAERDLPPATQAFQITLLVAGKGPASRPDLPASGRRALDDLESFLPYRSYTLLDAGVTRTADKANLALGGDQGYRAQIRFHGDPRTAPELKVEFAMDQVYQRRRDDGGAEDVHRDIVETSFSMSVGETVVVGTSRLDGGDEALVVLVTAAED